MNQAERLRVVKVIKGLLKIAKTAMPDTYYAEDSRTKAARKLIAELSPLEVIKKKRNAL